MTNSRRTNLFVGLPLNVKRHVILCGLSIDDGEIHDSFDPYPPPHTEASYWPEKRLEDEIKQLSFNPQTPDSNNARQDGSLIGHAWQFFRSIWPEQVRINMNVGSMNSKYKYRLYEFET